MTSRPTSSVPASKPSRGNAASHRIYAARWIAANPEKRAAHHAVRNALRRGEMERRPCWCGKAAQAHHPDYGRPLDVRWLCPKHHKAAHRAEPRAGAYHTLEEGHAEAGACP